jgi:hypothetical protein
MIPIKNFTDHPRIQKYPYDHPPEAIYLLDGRFYLGNDCCLKQITINELRYANMGEPFRHFARVEYTSEGQSDSIDIGASDAAILYYEARLLRGLNIRLDGELRKLNGFSKNLENILDLKDES